MITTIGIDPGLTGAVAMIDFAGKAEVFDIPTMECSRNGKVKRMLDGNALANMIMVFACDGDIAAIEQTSAMPGQGVSSMFSMGDSFGCCRGVLQALGIEVVFVRPAKWKKDLGLSSDKNGSLEMARKMFPDADLGRKKDHNRSEALLLAHWLQGESRGRHCR